MSRRVLKADLADSVAAGDLVAVKLNPERCRCHEVVYLAGSTDLNIRLETGVVATVTLADWECLQGQLDENGVPLVVRV